MCEETGRRTEADSPKSVARFVRRSAKAISTPDSRIGQYRAEYLALIEWADAHKKRLEFSFIEKFAFIGEGAEHRILH